MDSAKSIIKYPGSKWRIAKWIVSYFPEHNIYLEPFFGSGAVFFNKKPCKHETLNDLDKLVVNFFKVVRDNPKELARLIEFTPWSRTEYNRIQEDHAGMDIKLSGDSIEDARRFLVRCQQGFGSKLADRCGWKSAVKYSSSDNTALWNDIPGRIMLVTERLKNAQIECLDAIELIKKFNIEDCLIYADPPYLSETRHGRIYRIEMLDKNAHLSMLDTLIRHKGSAVISGYDNDLYNDALHGWYKESISSTADGGRERIETIWMNYEPFNQMRMSI